MTRSDFTRPIMTVMLAFFLIALTYFFRKRGQTTDPCALHHQLYVDSIYNGQVVKKFIDEENHATKTLLITANDTIYEVQMIPYLNWTDYERIAAGDKIIKDDSTFRVTVNNQFTFVLHYDCLY